MKKETENSKLVDVTLRDGGLVCDFHFSDEFVAALYRANLASGVDYMEFGYRADKKKYNESRFGKWKFASDEDIYSIVGENEKKLGISIMADVGRCDYKKDIKKKTESPVNLIRVATYIETMPECFDMIEYIARMGYQVTCHLMAISKYKDEQITCAIKTLSQLPVTAVYVVDSYGALYPKQIRHLTRLCRDILAPAGKITGIHAHNSQGCAFANTLEAKNCGAVMLDGSAYGMGRGAGNCPIEALLGCFCDKKYHPEPMLGFVEHYMLPLKESGVEWGYNTSYLLTGLTNHHPQSAIDATKHHDTDFVAQFHSLMQKKKSESAKP